MPFRVLQIINRNNLGGLLLIACNIAEGLQNEYEIKVLSGVKSEDEGDATHVLKNFSIPLDLIPTMKRSIHPVNDYASYKTLKKIIEEFKPHIVHTHAAKAGAIGRLAAYNAGVPVIIHQFHGHVFQNFFNRFYSKIFVSIEKYLATKCDAIITISDEVKNDIVHKYKVNPENKTYTIPIGVNFQKFLINNESNRQSFRNTYQVSETDCLIGIIGRVVSSKNVKGFVSIIKDTAQQTQKTIKAFIVGDGDDMTEVLKLIHEFKIRTYFTSTNEKIHEDSPIQNLTIYITSWLKDIEKVQAGMDIVLLPSLQDGTPVSLMEAQASCLPVVAFDAGGAKFTFENNVSGFLIQPNEYNLFVEKLLTLVEDENLRKKMGEEGRKYVINKFSLETMNNNIHHLYQHLLNQKNILS